MDLIDVYEEYREDPAFSHLRQPGIRLVPGRGAEEGARLFIVGEAPGAVENTKGQPFTGQSGRVLMSLLHDVAGIPDGAYFITNVVKYRPPGNRTPTIGETIKGRPYLRKEWIAVGRPKVLVAVGGVAFAAIGPPMGTVSQYAGQICNVRGGTYTWAMFHPAFGLRNKEMRPKMERDWDAFGQWIREEGLL